MSSDGCETAEACPFGTGAGAWFLAVNAQTVYWTNRTGATVLMQPRAGGATTPIASGQNQPGPIAVNAIHVYWVNFAGGGQSNVMRAQLDGSTPTPIASPEFGPYGIALDSTDVYWSNNPQNQVRGAPLDGGPAFNFTSGLRPGALAVDATTLYFVSNNQNPGDSVYAVRLSDQSQRVLAYNVSYPTGLVVDDTHVYFTRYYAGTIHRVAKDAGPTDGGDSIIVSGQSFPVGLTATSTELFWTNSGFGVPDAGRVMRAFKDGGEVRIFADAQSGPFSIVAIDNRVYWVNEISGTVVWGSQ